ncbi:MAG: EAL domain-containing protein [Betaproteobacteria bacterium]
MNLNRQLRLSDDMIELEDLRTSQEVDVRIVSEPVRGANHAPLERDLFGTGMRNPRYTSLLQLSSDWYWEQDENFRFIAVLDGSMEKPGVRRSDFIGKTRWELPCLAVSLAQWDAHRTLLRLHKPFYDFEYLRLSGDGAYRWVSINGEPMFDAHGRFIGYRGVGKDVTERKQTQQRQAVQLAVARHLSDSENLSDAMQKIIRAICKIMNWDYGTRWAHSAREQTFECAEIWNRPHLDGSSFIAVTREQRFTPQPGGLITRVLETHEPQWISDIASHQVMQRRAVALEAGLHAAFAFPITAGGRLLGALEFFTSTLWSPDLAITETARWVGRQIGQFMVRKQAEDSYRELVDLSPDGIIIHSEGRIVFANAAASRLFGAQEPMQLLGRATLDFIQPQFRARVAEQLAAQVEEKSAVARVEMTCLRLDGEPVHVEISSRYFMFEGTPAIQSLLRDVSERKAAERKIIRLGNLYAALSQTNKAIARLSEPEILLDQICRTAVEYGPFEMAAILMVDAESLVVKPVAVAGKHEAYIRSARISIDESVPEGRGLTGSALRNNQHIVCNDIAQDPRVELWREGLLQNAILASATFPLVRAGIVVGGLLLCAGEVGFFDRELVDLLLEMATSISFALDATDRERQRRQAEERLAFLAQYDVLTGLPNRKVLRDRLSHAIARARRNNAMVGVMFFDLDRFKQINDTLGHGAGDRVLQTIALRLREQMREVDTISRLGGDEFTLIVEGIEDAAQLVPVAEKIRTTVATPVKLDGREIFVSTSIGVTIYPRDGDDGEELIAKADIAMYRAKHEGRNNYQFYAPEMAALTHEHLYLQAELRHAMERNEFELYFQPTVEVNSGQIVGVEALLRWNSQAGMILPSDFIPVAEETGLIIEIGEWVLRTACAQATSWLAKGLLPLQLTVNLSARQFSQRNLLETISTALRETGLPPGSLELEITESTLMHQGEGVIDMLMRLNELGVRIAIDDFGTGYSSLAYLKRFPVQDIKVDQSFIRDITSDPDDAAIVKAIIAMAHSLDIRVIAEGVETQAQLAFLKQLKCDVFQGYLFSRPRSAEHFEELLNEFKTRGRVS